MDDIIEKQSAYQGPIRVIARTGFGIPKDIELLPEIKADAVIEYEISDIARYMLDPSSMEVRKRLIGCEIHRKQAKSGGLLNRIGRWTPWKKEADEEAPEELLAQPAIEAPSHEDKHFSHHISMINESLRSYDSFSRSLASLDLKQITDIIGICEDIDGNRSILHLEGDLPEKVQYMQANYGANVNVVLKSRQLGPGLFEMRGFDFQTYRPENQYRLIRFISSDGSKACVVNDAKQVEYWIADMTLIQYMLLLDQSIQDNKKFQNAFRLCISGELMPVKIMFHSKFEIGYSDSYLPQTYREIFQSCNLGMHEKDVVVESLNQLQAGVAFTYMTRNSDGKQKLFTHISVLHNVKALEPIRQRMPRLYSEINKRIPLSETKRFYLLDSIRGYVYA